MLDYTALEGEDADCDWFCHLGVCGVVLSRWLMFENQVGGVCVVVVGVGNSVAKSRVVQGGVGCLDVLSNQTWTD